MATRNIVPRATGEGQIGTSAKTWSAGYFNDIAVTNGVTASTFTGDVTGNVTGDVTGDVTGTASGNLPLSGGTMTGAISFDATGEIGYKATTHSSPSDPCKQLVISSTDIDHWGDEGGAKLALHTYDDTQTNTSEDGAFSLIATDGTNSKELKGKPDGTLTWGGKSVITAPIGEEYIKLINVSLNGSVSANNWGDYSATIPFPSGYSHVVGVTKINVPSPSFMRLVGFWQSGNSYYVRVWSATAISSTIDITLSVCK